MVTSLSISIAYSPILKLKDIQNRGEIKVPEHTTIGGLLQRLGIPANQHRYLLAYANGQKQGLGYFLKDGDALQLFLPIGGG